MGTVLLGDVATEMARHIHASAVDLPETSVAEVAGLEAVLSRVDSPEDSVDALVLGAVFDDPVGAAQRVHAQDRDLSVLILSEPSDFDQLKQVVQFSPFLGPEISCWPKAPVAPLTNALGDAVTRTRQRRHYRAMVDVSKSHTTKLDPSLLHPGEYLDRLLDHAPIGVVLLDQRQLTAALNRRARDLLEVGEREALGLSLREFVSDTDAVRLADFLKQIASSPHRTPPQRYSRTLRYGTAQVLEVTGAAISSRRGHQCTMVILLDVTERAHAELRRRRLMDELDHRVKNNLATVISLADRTLAGAGAEDFAVSFKGRLHALARVHEALAAARWEGVSLSDVVDLTLEPYACDAEHRFDIQGDDVLLSARAAPVLGMILHELATNAAKYGALSTPDGSIAIGWRYDADGNLQLTWVESDGPPVSRTDERGFGSEVITGLVRHDLSGEVDLDFCPTGVRCTISIPPPPRATRRPRFPA